MLLLKDKPPPPAPPASGIYGSDSKLVIHTKYDATCIAVIQKYPLVLTFLS